MKQELTAHFEPLLEVAEKLKELYERQPGLIRESHGFNLFTILLKETDETRLHSRFLQCLLDPQGSHGRGEIFLHLFLLTIQTWINGHGRAGDMPVVFPAARMNWTVRKEVGRSSGHGQLDLLLECDGWAVGIENKIYAYEQDRQLESYATFLEEQYPGKWQLLYLTLDGKESRTAGAHPYHRISYRDHILHWLNDCIDATRTYGEGFSSPVNQALSQYRHVVQGLTGRDLSDRLMEPILDEIIKRPNLLRFRKDLTFALEKAKTVFLNRLAAALIRGIESSGACRAGYTEGTNEETFGANDYHSLTLSGNLGEALLPHRFIICIENDLEDEVLALGVFLDVDEAKPSDLEAHWIREINRLTGQKPPGGQGAGLKSTNATEWWPLGWINLIEDLSDEGIACLIERNPENPVEILAEELCSQIVRYVQALLDASGKVEGRSPAIER
ncbi:MAG: hypothetical protein JWO82_1888 [Akkermansiaceae bacterium]|nr:hypothetical protein [Akkermansiaceae bacterium]